MWIVAQMLVMHSKSQAGNVISTPDMVMPVTQHKRYLRRDKSRWGKGTGSSLQRRVVPPSARQSTQQRPTMSGAGGWEVKVIQRHCSSALEVAAWESGC